MNIKQQIARGFWFAFGVWLFRSLPRLFFFLFVFVVSIGYVASKLSKLSEPAQPVAQVKPAAVQSKTK